MDRDSVFTVLGLVVLLWFLAPLLIAIAFWILNVVRFILFHLHIIKGSPHERDEYTYNVNRGRIGRSPWMALSLLALLFVIYVAPIII